MVSLLFWTSGCDVAVLAGGSTEWEVGIERGSHLGKREFRYVFAFVVHLEGFLQPLSLSALQKLQAQFFLGL